MDRRKTIRPAPSMQLTPRLKLIHNQPILLAALAFGFVAGLYNLVQEDVALVTLVVVTPAAILGFAKPKRAWLWAGIIALGIPISEMSKYLLGVESTLLRNSLFSFTEPASSSTLQTLMIMFLAECSAAAGLIIRKTLSRFGLKA